MGVAGARRCVTHNAGPGGSVLHGTAIRLVRVEYLTNAALGRIWHPAVKRNVLLVILKKNYGTAALVLSRDEDNGTKSYKKSQKDFLGR